MHALHRLSRARDVPNLGGGTLSTTAPRARVMIARYSGFPGIDRDSETDELILALSGHLSGHLSAFLYIVHWTPPTEMWVCIGFALP
jgi:hypothetical protein